MKISFEISRSKQLEQKAIKPTALSTILRMLGFSTNYNEVKIDSYSDNAALYSIINRITRTAATAPFKVYRVKDKKKFLKYKAWTGVNATKESLTNAMLIKEQVFEEDNNHELNLLIDKPNEFQRGHEFVANSIGYKLLTGNRYWFINKLENGLNAGKPFSIINLPPQHMSITGDGSLYGIKEYTLMLGQNNKIDKESIIHSKYWNPNVDASGTHLSGLSPLQAAKKNINRIDSGTDRSVNMLDNAGAAGILFDKGAAELSVEHAEAIKHKVNTEILGNENAAKISVANGDLGYINFGLSAVDMAILDMEKLSMQQLCNIYGVPFILFNSDSSSYNNIQEAKKELITMAVVPELASVRDDWNMIATYFKGENIYVDYDISIYPELQEDLEKTYRIMAGAWWATPNEKRLAMNMDEDVSNPLMNEYLIPSGLKKLEDLNVDLDAEMDQIDNSFGKDPKEEDK